MVIKKYVDLYGRKSQKLIEEIHKEVNYFFYNEIVNEAGVRILKARIENLVKNYHHSVGLNKSRVSENEENKDRKFSQTAAMLTEGLNNATVKPPGTSSVKPLPSVKGA